MGLGKQLRVSGILLLYCISERLYIWEVVYREVVYREVVYREVVYLGGMLCKTWTNSCCLILFINLFIPEFLKLTLPSLNLDRSTAVQTASVQNQKQNGKQYRSRWDGSLRAISSRSTLIAEVSILVCWAETVKYMSILLVQGLCKEASWSLNSLWESTGSWTLVIALHIWAGLQITVVGGSFLW